MMCPKNDSGLFVTKTKIWITAEALLKTKQPALTYTTALDIILYSNIITRSVKVCLKYLSKQINKQIMPFPEMIEQLLFILVCSGYKSTHPLLLLHIK